MEFTTQPDTAVVLIIKEFYENAKEAQHHVVEVQGKTVWFGKANINAYYNIEDMADDDQLMEYIQEDLDWDQVIRCLCRPGAKWTLKELRRFIFHTTS